MITFVVRDVFDMFVRRMTRDQYRPQFRRNRILFHATPASFWGHMSYWKPLTRLCPSLTLLCFCMEGSQKESFRAVSSLTHVFLSPQDSRLWWCRDSTYETSSVGFLYPGLLLCTPASVSSAGSCSHISKLYTLLLSTPPPKKTPKQPTIHLYCSIS